MTRRTFYLEPSKGWVHLGGHSGQDSTFCGRSDLSDGEDLEDLQEVAHGPVTCPDCAGMILHARGVHVGQRKRAATTGDGVTSWHDHEILRGGA